MAPTPTSACVCGCTQLGEHRPGCGEPCPCHCHDGADGMYPCSVPGGCYANHRGDQSEPCKGCLPSLATHGLLCERCRRSLGATFTVAADVVIHLRSLVPPGSAPERTEEKHTKASNAPVPLNLAAIDAADRIHAELCSWVKVASDELELVGPLMGPAWRTTGSGGQIAGLRASSTGMESIDLARWLIAHADQITAFEWVSAILEGPESLRGILRSADRAWPTEARPVRLPVRCKHCMQRALIRRQPAGPGMPTVIACQNCDYQLTEAGYEEVTVKELQQVQAERRAAQARERAARAATEKDATA